MNVFYITGSSMGLGKALCEILLEDPQNQVIGLSRTQTIKHTRYRHIVQDLKKPISSSIFNVFSDDLKKVILINNAGSIGPITKNASQSSDDIISNYQVNLIAPTVLSSQFINSYEKIACDKIIINISSGAAHKPIHGWSTYCSSKAGLDMLSQVLDQEYPSFKVFSISPGIIDTNMQREIRKANKTHFPRLSDFQGYKEAGELIPARDVSLKILKIINFSENFSEVSLSVRNL